MRGYAHGLVTRILPPSYIRTVYNVALSTWMSANMYQYRKNKDFFSKPYIHSLLISIEIYLKFSITYICLYIFKLDILAT